jgi:heme-degrading monooxygenase HmoA
VIVMARQLVSFRATLRDPSLREVHEEMVRGMRDLAEAIDGFVEWRDATEGLDYWGFVVFESDEAAQSWKAHPTHGAIHRQGEVSVYSQFATQVFEQVRGAEWRRDDD